MSFTAEVRDELSRCASSCEYCDLSVLAALTRVCGTLSISGAGHYQLEISTETGAVARTMIGLTHKVLHLKTDFTVRKSVLHKVRNYLIVLPDQPQLEKALILLGILDRKSRLVAGIPPHLTARKCCSIAYIRGAMIAGGFIADPRGDFHLEIAVQSANHAHELAELIVGLGIPARVNQRRSSFVVYIKSAADIKKLLTILGASRSVEFIDEALKVKSVKADVNRRVNAELANQSRSTNAAGSQLELIDKAEKYGLYKTLPPALKYFCELRRDFPEMSLRELGEMADPPLSKSALYHRVCRLEKIIAEHETE